MQTLYVTLIAVLRFRYHNLVSSNFFLVYKQRLFLLFRYLSSWSLLFPYLEPYVTLCANLLYLGL